MVKHSPDRSAIVRLYKAGRPPATIAKHLDIYRSVVYRTFQRYDTLVDSKTAAEVEDLVLFLRRRSSRCIPTVPRRLLSSAQQARVKKCRQLLLRTGNKGQHSIVSSDKKLYTVEQQFIAQNVRVIARNAKEADKKGRVVHRAAQPVQFTVWAGICASGKTPLIFVDPDFKFDKDYYLKTILEGALLP
ncbi:unnamed protein product [Haemonchus placei]|uniref:Homeodomain-like domain-containing protein n=1 Tax=Haemonchus placei TaxID=6290 RepID=A0A0N4W474_HAEPC|nr:unnamed protein product [Haemonchus placei]